MPNAGKIIPTMGTNIGGKYELIINL